MGSRPPEGMEDEDLTDAGGGFISAVPGAATVDSTLSFGLIRGGHLDVTVLGGLEVDEQGHLANWVVPGKMVPGMGGAMDLVSGARRVIVAMQHTARGRPKIVPKCTLPLTSLRRVTLVVTDLAVIEPTDAGLVLRERAPGVSVADVLAATSARTRRGGRHPGNAAAVIRIASIARAAAFLGRRDRARARPGRRPSGRGRSRHGRQPERYRSSVSGSRAAFQKCRTSTARFSSSTV